MPKRDEIEPAGPQSDKAKEAQEQRKLQREYDRGRAQEELEDDDE